MGALADALAFAAALGAGLVAGVFLAFSSFVMAALARLEPACGIAAMQAINRTVLNPLFLGVLLGTALAAVALLPLAALGQPGAPWFAGGAALYLLGCFGVTVLANVPRNAALARLDPRDPASAAAWDGYLSGWTAWNHIRCAAALGAAALLVAGLR
jgi:uncharacterized membrane protein